MLACRNTQLRLQQQSRRPHSRQPPRCCDPPPSRSLAASLAASLAVSLAAPAHDLDHRGRSNALEIAEETDIAKEFPDEKVRMLLVRYLRRL